MWPAGHTMPRAKTIATVSAAITPPILANWPESGHGRASTDDPLELGDLFI
jgi:hypothetical protein